MRLSLNTREIDYNKTVLYWEAEPDIKEDLNFFTFLVQISESPEGPWTNVFTDPIHAFGFIDTITQRGMADQRLYYRVVGLDYDGTPTISNLISLADEQDNYISRYIKKQQQLQLKRLNGRDCLHYARRKFGPRCHHCYDPIDRKVTRSKCPFCFGTTYKGGFFAPIKIHVNFDTAQKSIDKNEYEVTESIQVGAWTTCEAIIENGDVIIALKNPDVRYLATGITPSTIQDAVTRQLLILTQVVADRVEQLIPIDYNAYTLEEFLVFRREWNR